MTPEQHTDPAAPQTVGAAGRGGPRRAALAFIFVTVLIDILSFGLIIPVLPHLVKSPGLRCLQAHLRGSSAIARRCRCRAPRSWSPAACC